MIGTIPILGADELAAMAARAREAGPQWEAIGFEGRARILRRAQKWFFDNADRVLDQVVAETGKTYEDAQLTDFGYTVSALRFWAKEAAKYLADERVRSWDSPTVAGKKLVIRYAPMGLVGVIGPWKLPIVNAFGDCIPAGDDGRQHGDPLPSEVTPLSALLMADARVRSARGRLPGRHRRRLHRRSAHLAGGLRHVHRLHAPGGWS